MTTTTTTTTDTNLPVCAICGHTSHYIGDHIQEAHGMSLADYSAQYPNAPIASAEVVAKINSRRKRRAEPTKPTELKAMFHDFDFDINLNVPVEVCGVNGERPAHYRLPSAGDAKRVIFDVLLDVVSGASQIIYGPAGTGKDAFWLNFSWVTRTPCISIQINPDVDISKVLFSHEISAENGTFQKMGSLARCLTDGYTCEDGTVIPFLVVLTDIDRATVQQAEHLRLMLDSVQKRIQHPDGHTIPIIKGTRIVATANSIGNGSGRYASAQVMDNSILSRFESKWEFCTLHWSDEEIIIRNKFPLLSRHCGHLTYGEDTFFQNIGRVVSTIRSAIKTNSIEMEFGHRELCGWMKHLQSRVEYCVKRNKSLPSTLLKDSFRQVRGAVDENMRDQLNMLVDTYIKGGVVDQGNTSHIDDGELMDF